ncbi:ABC transporter ATP-binding protein [Streptomyces triculaminicus]|uniref:ABC transporter ATP-binding protein n=1 Tax=Streptomyces triculaminicus TaxID=2816232 RepID=A0A939FWG6_9ACTN|nr:ABC transporter ATP-binding protein [Streptomyces triculaminicus]MBO0657202.1 ABC transporter ATP-binding protein [Streptomyces triculaminicus]
MAEEISLVVTGLCKDIDGATILDEVGFRAGPGITGLVGPNGAGKTTLMRCIAGILAPTRGGVAVCGQPAGSDHARQLTSLMPEHPDLYPGLTVAEHVAFIGRLHRAPRWRDHAAQLLERYQLTDKADKLPRELSQGMCRKLALVLALLKGARVLLFDEPFNGLDPEAAIDLRAELEALRAQGALVLLSMHALADLERLADRLVFLREGRIRAAGSLDDLRAEGGAAGLEEIYLQVMRSATGETR